MEKLPMEMLYMVLDNLPLSEKIKYRRVCKTWKITIDEICLPKQRSVKVFQSLRHMKSYDNFCLQLKLSSFSRDVRESFCQNDRLLVSSMSQNGDPIARFLIRLTKNLRHITLSCDDLSCIGIEDLLDGLPKIKSLSLMDYYLCSSIRQASHSEMILKLNSQKFDFLLLINLCTTRRGLDDYVLFPHGTLGPTLYELETFAAANCLVSFDRILTKFNPKKIRKFNVEILEVSLPEMGEYLFEKSDSEIIKSFTHFGAQTLATRPHGSEEITIRVLSKFENLVYLDLSFASQMPFQESLRYIYLLTKLKELSLTVGSKNSLNAPLEGALPRPALSVENLNIEIADLKAFTNLSYFDCLSRIFPNAQHFTVSGKGSINVWFAIIKIPERESYQEAFLQKVQTFPKFNSFQFFQKCIFIL